MNDWMVRLVIWICDRFDLDYVLSIKRPSGVWTKINASRDDLFLVFGGIVLSMRKTLEADDDEYMREFLQNMAEHWEETRVFSDKARKRS